MKCKNCSFDFPDTFKFCPECGSPREASDPGTADEENLPPPRQDMTSQKTDVDTRTVIYDQASLERAATTNTMFDNRYEIGEMIGCGGFALVFKAKDAKLGNRVVAIKLLQKKDKIDDDWHMVLERFLRESSVIASLNHKNIVTIHDCSSEVENHYIVMEYISGGNLREYLAKKGGKLSVREAFKILKCVCQGLAFAHRKNLIHRDMKPSNIMLVFDGDEIIPKIVDFGLARVGESTDMSISGFGMGTPAYMSPEQRRDAKSVNHTTDIYSIGKMLYEIVTGEDPENIDPEKVKEYPEVADIVFKCLKTRPEERYFSADLIIEDFDSYLVGKDKARKNISGDKNVDPSLFKCPVCSTPNVPDSKFCAGCGNGLSCECPECGTEVASHLTFCKSCGTDIQGFSTAKEALEKIEENYDSGKWIQIIKTYEQLPKDLKLQGSKGSQVVGKIHEIYLNVKDKVEEESFYSLCTGKSANFEEVEKYEDAIVQLENYLGKFSDGMHFPEIRQKINKLKKLVYKGPSPGDDWKLPWIDLELAPIPAGEFQMGSPAGKFIFFGREKGRRRNEAPFHMVRLSRHFWIGICPVTIGAYIEFISSKNRDPFIKWTPKGCPVDKAGGNPSIDEGFWGNMLQPMVELPWHAANAFCRWLTERERKDNRLPEGYIYRLPTEAEWEYSCRAGTCGRFFFGNNEEELEQYAWFARNSGGKTHPVGIKKPNQWGLFDMYGNVWEWCHDKYDSYSAEDTVNPTGPKLGTSFVRRGGSWINDYNHCRSACRNNWEPGAMFKYLGFRIVLAHKIEHTGLY